MFALHAVCVCAGMCASVHMCFTAATSSPPPSLMRISLFHTTFFSSSCVQIQKEISLRQRELRERVRKKTSVERENKLRCDDDNDDGDGETATAVQSIISFSV